MDSRRQVVLRRLVLFLSILISGGLVLLPRLPLLVAVLLGCAALSGPLFNVHRRLLLPIGFLLVLLLVALVRPQGFDLSSTAIRFANFAAGLAVLGVYLRARPDALSEDLFCILRWMAVQAVLTLPLAVFADFLFVSLPVGDTIYRTFLLLLTYHVYLADSGALPRPDGFFFEPGVFQIYLNIYLYLALFVYKKVRHAALGIAAVLATQSTTGMIILLLILTYAALSKIKDVSWNQKFIVLAAAVVVGLPLVSIGVDNIENKTVGDQRGSAWAREYDLYTGVNVIAEHPWVGIGFDYQDYYARAAQLGYADTPFTADELADRGNSNGIITLIYSVGVPFSLIFFFGLFRQRFFPHRPLFAICLLLSLFGEALFFSPFVLLIVFSGISTDPGRFAPNHRPRPVST